MLGNLSLTANTQKQSFFFKKLLKVNRVVWAKSPVSVVIIFLNQSQPSS